MDELESLNHTKWDCKYHVVFIPKCRRKTLYVQLRQYLGEVFRKLAQQKESRIEEGHLMVDHVHMMISPTEVRCFAGDWLHQGQERDTFGTGVWGESPKFRWAELLGTRIFRINGRARRRGDPQLHPEPGGGGPTSGADEPLALTATLEAA